MANVVTQKWHAQRRHYRDLRDRLADRGIAVLQAWNGKHLRLRVSRDGRETTITIASSPSIPEHAVANTMQQAIRALRA